MLNEQEQAFIQGIELSKDMNLEIPDEDLKRYYDILQKEHFTNLRGNNNANKLQAN